MVGLARSGAAVARLLGARGETVIGVDSGHPREAEGLEGAGVEVHLGVDGTRLLTRARTLVKSPGVPQDAPVVAAARERGIEVTGELELAWRLIPNVFCGVTGTNGKTTTTELIGHLYRTAGRAVAVAGNVGTPLASLVGEVDPEATVVCECSSFQLEDSALFSPETAVLVNLAPDHLDRHGTLDAYLDAKLRIFANQGNDDVAVFNGDTPELHDRDIGGCARRVRFCPTEGEAADPDCEVSLADGLIFADDEPLVRTDELRVLGAHNVENAMAAAAAALASGLPRDSVADGLRGFEGVPHRLERIAEIDEVLYVNDSKATNVASAVAALESFDGGVHLIAGGRPKQESFTPLVEPVKRNCVACYLIGEAAERLAQELAPVAEAGVDDRAFRDPGPGGRGSLEAREAGRGRPALAGLCELRRVRGLRGAWGALPRAGGGPSMSLRPGGRTKRQQPPPLEYSLLLTATLCLLAFGAVMVFSASSARSLLTGEGNGFHYLERTLVFGAIGLCVMRVLALRGLAAARTLTPLMLLASLFLLVVVLAPGVGQTVNGAQRWIGAGALQFQPSELAKLSLVLYGAHLLAAEPRRARDLRGLAPYLLVVGGALLLISMQPDLGTSIIIASAVCSMLFLAGVRARTLAPVGLAIGLIGLTMIATNPYQQERLTGFLNPGADLGGAGFQSKQATIAVGSGGIFGVGLGESVQKASYLPEAHTDMIAAVIGEELGLAGMFVLIGLFGMFGYAGSAGGPPGPRPVQQAGCRRSHVADPGPGGAQPVRGAGVGPAHGRALAVRLLWGDEPRDHARLGGPDPECRAAPREAVRRPAAFRRRGRRVTRETVPGRGPCETARDRRR